MKATLHQLIDSLPESSLPLAYAALEAIRLGLLTPDMLPTPVGRRVRD